MSAYHDGYCSFPNKRINYPDSPGLDEIEWIKGYNKAQFDARYNFNSEGLDTYAWNYKKG